MNSRQVWVQRSGRTRVRNKVFSGRGVLHRRLVLECLEGRTLLAVTPTAVPVLATEGSAFSGLVATFTSNDPLPQLSSNYSATITWGDGATTAGIVSVDPNVPGRFDVTGTHTYAEEANRSTSILVNDLVDATNATANGSASVADAGLAGSGTSLTAVAGVPFSGIVGGFTDANPNPPLSDFSATINWGDGTTTAASITNGINGGFRVNGAHTYAAAGAFVIGVVVNDVGGSTISFSSSANVSNVANGPLALNAFPWVATEGKPMAGVPIAAFLDAGTPAPLAAYTATVDWGDGGAPQAATITSSGANFTVLAPAHTYAEEGNYPVTVKVTKSPGGTATAVSQATVADAPLTATPTSLSLTGTAGTPISGVLVAFTDADPAGVLGDYSATINWGDGVITPGTIAANGSSGFNVSGSHAYAAGTFPVSVKINDIGGSKAIVNGVATVADAALTPGAAVPVKATEGLAFAGVVASFTAANPIATPGGFIATITWGDGHTSAGAITENAAGTFFVSGTNTYAEEGSFPVSVAIRSSGGNTATATTSATVADAPLSATGLAIHATVGQNFSGVVALFTDANPASVASEFTATINWGDGVTTAGTIAANGGGYTVSGSHVYSAATTLPISVLIHDAGGSTVTAFGTATVAEAPLTLTASPVDFTVVEGRPFSGTVATFTGFRGPSSVPEPASAFQATIDWGDGSPPTQGTIVGQPGGNLVTGIHTYADSGVNGGAGTFPVTVTIHHSSGQFVRVISTATVIDEALNLTGQLNPASDSGESHSDAITKVNQPNFFGNSEPFSTVRLFAQPEGGLGLFPIGSGVADASGFWSITSALLPDGRYTITAGAVDQSGNTTAETQILPNDVQGPLVIDTVGPKVTDGVFDRRGGRFFITFQDELSGMDQRSLIDGAGYAVTKAHSRPGQFLITSLTTSTPANPTDPQTVIATINNGRSLRGGRYQLTVRAGKGEVDGVRDVAGNPLDGEFYGTTPSGNNIPGGKFVALVNSVHRTTFPPQPLFSSASPNNPPAPPPGPTVIQTAKPTTTVPVDPGLAPVQAIFEASHTHDLALQQVVQSRKPKRQG